MLNKFHFSMVVEKCENYEIDYSSVTTYWLKNPHIYEWFPQDSTFTSKFRWNKYTE